MSETMYATILENWDEQELLVLKIKSNKAGFDFYQKDENNAVIVAESKLWGFLGTLSGSVKHADVGFESAEEVAERLL